MFFLIIQWYYILLFIWNWSKFGSLLLFVRFVFFGVVFESFLYVVVGGVFVLVFKLEEGSIFVGENIGYLVEGVIEILDGDIDVVFDLDVSVNSLLICISMNDVGKGRKGV